MTDLEFNCPSCGRAIPADGPVREAVLAHGCPVCGVSVSGEQFA